jgi:hypothetical protein
MLLRLATSQRDPLIFSTDHINSARDEVDIPRQNCHALFREVQHLIPVIDHRAASEEGGGVAPESVHSRVFLPADGLRLLGQHQGDGDGGRRFLVDRGDGAVIQLPLLPYLVMAAIAEGGVDGGWTADQVGARVRSASGQGLTVDTVRYLIAGKLAPLGLIAADGTDDPDAAVDAGRRPWMTRPAGVTIGGVPLPRGAAEAVGRALPRPIAGRVERLLLPHRRRRWAFALGGTAVLVCVAATAPIMAETGGGGKGRAGPASSSVPSLVSAPLSAAAGSRLAAAAWVAQQVSPDVTVSCDPAVCQQLRLDGFPAGRLKPLGSGVRALPGSGIVVATPAVRGQLGSRLSAAYAPQVIASFGAGAARVDVRVIAPSGPAAFRTQLAAEQTALASAGRQLLGNKNIQASSSARAALAGGQVDARLLAILSLLSAQLPIRLVAFTGAPGAGSGVALRGAEIGVASPAARSTVVGLLDAQQGAYRPAAVTVLGGGTRALVGVRFDAPADLNISQP